MPALSVGRLAVEVEASGLVVSPSYARSQRPSTTPNHLTLDRARSGPPAPLARPAPGDVEGLLLYHVLCKERAARLRSENMPKGSEPSELEVGETKVRFVKAMLAANLTKMLSLFNSNWDPERTGLMQLVSFRAALREIGHDLSMGDGKLFWTELGADTEGNVSISKLGRVIRGSGFEIDSAIGGGEVQVGPTKLHAYKSTSEFLAVRSEELQLDLTLDQGDPRNNTLQMRMRRALSTHLSKVLTLFRAWDVDGNGTINKDELWLALERLELATSRAQSDAVFAEFDSDGSGEIEYQELNRQLRIGNLDGERLPERERWLSDNRQRQVGSLPRLARGDLRERRPPPAAERSMGLEELNSFFARLAEAQRNEAHELPPRADGADGGSGWEGAGEEEGWLHEPVHRASSALSLSPALGEEALGRPDSRRAGLLLAPVVSSGRAVSPTRRILSAGGGVRVEVRPAGLRVAASRKADPSFPPSSKSLYRAREVVKLNVPRRYGELAYSATQDEADYVIRLLTPESSQRPFFGADAAANGFVLGEAEVAGSAPLRSFFPSYSVLPRHLASGGSLGAIYAPPGPSEMLAATRSTMYSLSRVGTSGSLRRPHSSQSSRAAATAQ